MTSETISLEQARKALEQEKQERLAECQEGIAALLEQHRCTLVAQINVTPDGRLLAVPVLTNREE